MPQFIDTRALNDDARNTAAREAALHQVSWPQNLAPPTVSYVSHGHVAIVGPADAIRRAAGRLADSELASVTLIATLTPPDVPLKQAGGARLVVLIVLRVIIHIVIHIISPV